MSRPLDAIEQVQVVKALAELVPELVHFEAVDDSDISVDVEVTPYDDERNTFATIERELTAAGFAIVRLDR